jgi:uncharacterized glyoxalase superfamily protein PhnB
MRGANAIEWWQQVMGPQLESLCHLRGTAKLEEIAEQVLDIKITSAAVERAHSRFKHVFDSSRASIHEENMEKLFKIYCNERYF